MVASRDEAQGRDNVDSSCITGVTKFLACVGVLGTSAMNRKTSVSSLMLAGVDEAKASARVKLELWDGTAIALQIWSSNSQSPSFHVYLLW